MRNSVLILAMLLTGLTHAQSQGCFWPGPVSPHVPFTKDWMFSCYTGMGCGPIRLTNSFPPLEQWPLFWELQTFGTSPGIGSIAAITVGSEPIPPIPWPGQPGDCAIHVGLSVTFGSIYNPHGGVSSHNSNKWNLPLGSLGWVIWSQGIVLDGSRVWLTQAIRQEVR